MLGKGFTASLSRERIRLPNGHEMEHDIIHLPAAVAVLPLIVDEAGDRSVILVEQFRNPVRGYMHEIPAGVVEEGEDLEACGRRELEEETGYRAGRMLHLASLLMIPGTSAYRLHYFLAEELTAGSPRPERAECLQVRRVPFDPLVRRLIEEPPGSTVVVDGKTHLALLHASMHLALREKGMSP